MPSDVLSRWPLSPGPFTHRTPPHRLAERMDEPTDRSTLTGCLEHLAWANRIFGAYAPTLRFLDRLLAHRPATGTPLRLLDVGCGYGDMLRAIARWAQRRGVDVELTGVDLSPLAVSIAEEATAREGLAPGAITWRVGDAAALNEQPPDVVLTALVMHHLEDGEAVAMLRWMEERARLGWFINDLERQPWPVLVWSATAVLLRWHPFLKNDGPVSFRRAFRVDDWQRLLAQAGIAAGAAEVHKVFPARLCVTRLR